MRQILVDTNVLLDVITEDKTWCAWSSAKLAELAARDRLCINPIIYAEVAAGFKHIETLDAALPVTDFTRLYLPWAAAFLAGQVFVQYRRAGGVRNAPLPDFFIGAHAAVSLLPLVTRDAARYRSYFPSVEVISPELE